MLDISYECSSSRLLSKQYIKLALFNGTFDIVDSNQFIRNLKQTHSLALVLKCSCVKDLNDCDLDGYARRRDSNDVVLGYIHDFHIGVCEDETHYYLLGRPLGFTVAGMELLKKNTSCRVGLDAVRNKKTLVDINCLTMQPDSNNCDAEYTVFEKVSVIDWCNGRALDKIF